MPVVNRLFAFAARGSYQTQIVKRAGIFRRERSGLFERDDGFIQTIQMIKRRSHVIEHFKGGRAVGVQALELSDGPRVISARRVLHAQIKHGLPMIRNLTQHGLKNLYGLARAPRSRQQHSQIRARRESLRIQSERFQILTLCRLRFPLLIQDYAQQIMRIRIFRRARQDATNESLRFMQLSRLHERRRFTQQRKLFRAPRNIFALRP